MESDNIDLRMNARELSEPEKTFLIEQYKTLREEISEIKKRIFRLTTGSAVIIPLVNFFYNNKGFILILVPLPLVITALALNYLSEKNSLIRAGHFIKNNIEPHFHAVVGWEGWLECVQENRSVEKIEKYAFSIMFAVFYVLTSLVSLYTLSTYPCESIVCEKKSFTASVIAGILYCAIGYFSFSYFAKNVKTSTESSNRS